VATDDTAAIKGYQYEVLILVMSVGSWAMQSTYILEATLAVSIAADDCTSE
jgi:hypothetical protein